MAFRGGAAFRGAVVALAVVAAVVVAVRVAGGLGQAVAAGHSAVTQPAVGFPTTGHTSATLQAPAPQQPAPVAPGVPVEVTIPAIGVHSALQPLGLLPDGSLESPSQWQRAGWYDRGVRPGAVGPAVIVGHVDSVNGPAVFFRLRQVHPGAEVVVVDAKGVSRRFTVTGIRSYPKDTFPTAVVYAPTPLPELRLITCTGDFDQAAHSYLNNLVVSAVLDTPAAP